MKRVLQFLLVSSLLTLLGAGFLSLQISAQDNLTPAGDLAALVENFGENAPAWLRESGAPGAAIALVDGGEVAWSGHFGNADEGLESPVTADTLFQAASLSKVATALGVLALVESGEVALDAPVERYLRRWHFPSSEYDLEGVTVERLLSHTAGVAPSGYPGWHPDVALPTLEESLNGVNNGAGAVRLVAEPGAAWSYSGGGYAVLQLMIEEVTGMPFADYMQQRILEPLGMHSSTFRWSPGLTVATPYDSNGDALPNFRFVEEAPAGLYTTAEDFARLLAASLPALEGSAAQGSAAQGVLADESIARMLESAPNTEGRQGLGFALQELEDGTRLIQHGGSNIGWKAQMDGIPASGTGIVVLTNSDLGIEFYTQVRCAWLRSVTGSNPQECRTMDMTRSFLRWGAILLLVGLGFYVAWILVGLARGERSLRGGNPEKSVLRRVLRVALPLLGALLLWWLIYEDQLMRIVAGVPHITLRMLFPGAVNWFMLALILWCVVFALTAFVPRRQPATA